MNNKTVEVKNLSELEIKAISYENIKQIDSLQKGLALLENELASRAKNTQTKPKMEEEVKVEAPVEEVAEEVVETPTETTEETVA